MAGSSCPWRSGLSPLRLKSLPKRAGFYSGLKEGFHAKPQSRQGEEKERRSRRQEPEDAKSPVPLGLASWRRSRGRKKRPEIRVAFSSPKALTLSVFAALRETPVLVFASGSAGLGLGAEVGEDFGSEQEVEEEPEDDEEDEAGPE